MSARPTGPDGPQPHDVWVQLDHLPMPGALLDGTQYTLLVVNDRFAAMLGATPSALVGRSLVELLPRDQGVLLRELVEHLDEGPHSRDLTVGISPSRRRDGRLGVARTGDHVLLTFTDLTEERTFAATARRERAALRSATRRTGHDLKIPLTVVSGYARMLAAAEAELSTEDRRRLLRRIADASDRAAEQIAQLLDEPDERVEPSSSVDLAAVAAWLEGLTALAFDEIGALLVTDIHDDVVDVDAGVLRQVLLNLVNNALEHASRPDRALRVHVTSRRTAGGLEVLVTDNGPGIDHDIDEVFRSGAHRLDGQGTGLATCTRIAEAMGGWLTNVPFDGGTRFVLWLPVGDASPAIEMTEADDLRA